MVSKRRSFRGSKKLLDLLQHIIINTSFLIENKLSFIQKQLTLQKKKRKVRSNSSHSFFTTMRAAVPVFAALSS